MEYKGRAERNQGGGSGTDLVRESLAVMKGGRFEICFGERNGRICWGIGLVLREREEV